jgi:ubiquinone/menaquinone biosynthesis C-methylase UbiE
MLEKNHDKKPMTKNEKISSNPWLSIPWQEYEGHMASPQVQQAQFLSDIFRDALMEYRPRVVSVLGCSTGNGFENIEPSITHEVIGVDINPEYLEVLQERYGSTQMNLRPICADLNTLELDSASCNLIYCGLVFEYVEPRVLVGKIARWLKTNGKLVVVLQLPSNKSKLVSETKYKSLKRLEPIMKLVEPLFIQQACFGAGLSETRTFTRVLETSKGFFVGHYSKQNG